MTNRSMFVSALFFMVVVTIMEWLPVLQVELMKLDLLNDFSTNGLQRISGAYVAKV